MRRTRRFILLLMLFSVALQAALQQSCSSVTLTPAKSITSQIADFLADQKVSIAGNLIGFIANIRENPKLAALGTGLSLAHDVAVYVQQLYGNKPATIQLCPAPSGVTSPTGAPLSFIGTSADLNKVLGTRSSAALGELLKPYQTTSATVIPQLKLPALSANLLTQNWPSLPIQAPPTRMPPTQATVSGMVLDERGNPVSGAIVTLVASVITIAQPQWRMTADNGAYSFTDSPGVYSISARLNSGFQDAELRSDAQQLSLGPDSPRRINLYLHPPVRSATDAAEQVSPEEWSDIKDFIAAADQSETNAAYYGDSRYLDKFYAGEALADRRDRLARQMQAAMVSELKKGTVQKIWYLPAAFRIEVETVELWTTVLYDPQTRREISRKTGENLPQTISIQQTPRGWYITNIRFHK